MAQVVTGPYMRFSPELIHEVKLPLSNERVFSESGFLLTEPFEWLHECRLNGCEWRWRKREDQPEGFAVIKFQHAKEALLFKLTWGGC